MMRAPTTMFGQILAYAIGGGAMTLLHSLSYWAMAEMLLMEPYLANSLAAVAAATAGYLLHSRWTFGHTAPETRGAASVARYAVVSLLAYLLNSFWVWLVVKHWGRSVGTSVLPMVVVTPWLGFVLNRFWTFKQ
jgi:putative flippase GtrA